MSPSLNKTSNQWIPGGPVFPTTSEIGLLEADEETVVDAFVKWRASLGQSPERKPIQGGFTAGLQALLPLTDRDRRRWTFFRVGSWTAFFDNGARGTDAGPVTSFLARRLRCRGLRAASSPDGPDTYAATILELYGAHETEFLNYERTISVVNDGGRWRFDQSGNPLPFEDVEAYGKRRIKDRFTHSMLAQYLAAVVGVPPFDPSVYEEPVLVARGDAAPPGMRELDLEEARARFSLSRKV